MFYFRASICIFNENGNEERAGEKTIDFCAKRKFASLLGVKRERATEDVFAEWTKRINPYNLLAMQKEVAKMVNTRLHWAPENIEKIVWPSVSRKCHITARSANSFQHTELINCFYWWRVNELIGIERWHSKHHTKKNVWSLFWLEQGEHVECAHVLLAFINCHNYFQYSFLLIPQWVKARWTEYEKKKKICDDIFWQRPWPLCRMSRVENKRC